MLFQKATDRVLLGLPWGWVLNTLEEYGLHVNQDRCLFFQDSVAYLDHIIDASGLHKSAVKVSTIVEVSTLNNVGHLRSSLEMINYYGCFIFDLATAPNPLLSCCLRVINGQKFENHHLCQHIM